MVIFKTFTGNVNFSALWFSFFITKNATLIYLCLSVLLFLMSTLPNANKYQNLRACLGIYLITCSLKSLFFSLHMTMVKEDSGACHIRDIFTTLRRFLHFQWLGMYSDITPVSKDKLFYLDRLPLRKQPLWILETAHNTLRDSDLICDLFTRWDWRFIVLIGMKNRKELFSKFKLRFKQPCFSEHMICGIQ